MLNKLYLNSIEFPEMNYKHFRKKNAKFHIFVLLSIMGGISLITIYDRKFRHNRPEEGLPKMITYISPINMLVAEDNHLYFAYKSPLGCGRALNTNSPCVFWEKKLFCSPKHRLLTNHSPVSANLLISSFSLLTNFSPLLLTNIILFFYSSNRSIFTFQLNSKLP